METNRSLCLVKNQNTTTIYNNIRIKNESFVSPCVIPAGRRGLAELLCVTIGISFISGIAFCSRTTVSLCSKCHH